MNCGGIRTIYRTGQVTLGRRAEWPLVGTLRIAHHRVVMIHVVVVPDGLEIVPGEGIGVQHPAECLRNEATVRCIALFLGCYAQRTKDWPPVPDLGPALLRLSNRNAPVHVPVPPSDAERNALIE